MKNINYSSSIMNSSTNIFVSAGVQKRLIASPPPYRFWKNQEKTPKMGIFEKNGQFWQFS